MSKFKAGDRVVVNGALVAEILTYDEASNVVAYVSQVGGGTDTTYGHISNTKIERLVTDREVEEGDDRTEAEKPDEDVNALPVQETQVAPVVVESAPVEPATDELVSAETQQ